MDWDDALRYPRGQRPLRTLVAENDRVFAEALMFTLDTDPRVEAIGYALNGWEALELVVSLEPDVALIGTSLAGLDPGELTRWIHEVSPDTLPVLVRDRLVPEEIEELYAAGAADCIPASSSADELLHAISMSNAALSTAPSLAATTHAVAGNG